MQYTITKGNTGDGHLLPESRKEKFFYFSVTVRIPRPS